jgi:hypothetical protein
MMMSPPEAGEKLVLNSWKEIANHVGRGVRTVQRWERDLGMPVRRPRAKSRSAVIAMADEIDAWLRATPTADRQPKGDGATSPAVANLRISIKTHLDLRGRCMELRNAHRNAMVLLVSNLQALQQCLQQQGGEPPTAALGSATSSWN